MKQRLAIGLAILLSGCLGDDYYYLGPYSPPEPQQTAGCGVMPRPPAETAPPPLAGNRLPAITQSSSSIGSQSAEPALATTQDNSQTGWQRVFP